MTDTAFFDEMFALATELMNDFGTPATLRQVTVGEIDADGKAAKSTTDHPGLAVRLTDTEILRQLELAGDIGYVIKMPVEAKAGDLLIHAGRTMEVVNGKYVNPEGTRLMLSFHGVKDA